MYYYMYGSYGHTGADKKVEILKKKGEMRTEDFFLLKIPTHGPEGHNPQPTKHFIKLKTNSTCFIVPALLCDNSKQ